MNSDYLESVIKQFEYYRMLGDKTMAQLTDDELFWVPHADGNSVSTVIAHLSGNMLSRWTNFLEEDGEKEWRNRDAEFDPELETRAEVIDAWNKGWDCLFAAIKSLTESDLDKLIYIRNQGHSITEAINRQLAHYSYHVGQIVLLGKIIKGENWQSLSIAKGASKSYNAEKFAQEKKRGHFTDEYLKKE